jgi:hypothetical protein
MVHPQARVAHTSSRDDLDTNCPRRLPAIYSSWTGSGRWPRPVNSVFGTYTVSKVPGYAVEDLAGCVTGPGPVVHDGGIDHSVRL